MPDPAYLTAEDLVMVAATANGGPVAVRDYGLLDAAASRPRASAFGQDAYTSIHTKAAALMQSIVMNHALVDGNKRLGWLATYVFYDLNSYDVEASTGQGFDLTMAVINDKLDVDTIAEHLARMTKPR